MLDTHNPDSQISISTADTFILRIIKNYKGDGGVGTFDVEGACLHFWFKSSNFLDARLIRVQNSYNKIKLNFNDL